MPSATLTVSTSHKTERNLSGIYFSSQLQSKVDGICERCSGIMHTTHTPNLDTESHDHNSECDTFIILESTTDSTQYTYIIIM